MDKENKHINDIDSRSGRELALELGRLLLLLVWKIIKKGIRVAARFLLFVLDSVHDGCVRLAEWWNDNDTQAKVAKVKATLRVWCVTFGRWCVIALKYTVKWVKIATIALLRGLVIAVRATIVGLLHLKTTLITLAHLSVKGWQAMIVWLKRCRRGMRLWHIHRKRAYQRFRQNKGFKGLLIDMSTAVRNGMTNFMEEDELEAAPDAVTEDELLMEQLEQRMGDESKAARLGQKIISKAKDLANDG